MESNASKPTLRPALIVGVIGVAALAAAIAFWPHPATTAAPPAPGPAPATAPPAAPVPTPASAPSIVNADPKERVLPILYPDGSSWPSLNGVKVPPAITWPAGKKFSPVVGRFTDNQGIEWYRHGDGSQSTVRMGYRDDLKRMDAFSTVLVPTETVGIAAEDLDRAGAQPPKRK